MHHAVTEIVKKVKKAHNCVAAVSYSLRYGKGVYNPDASNSPTAILTLWKATVMPQFTLYLRYLRLDSQIQTLQKELNSSLRRTLRVYGIDQALLAEVGIPPLHYIQKVQLSQLCYRLRTSASNLIPFSLFRAWTTVWSIAKHQSPLEHRILQAVGYLDTARLSPDADMPKAVKTALPVNKERSYKYFLEKLASELWLQELQAEPPGRLWAYVNLHLGVPLRRHLFQPAPYLRANSPYQLMLLRLRAQSWPNHIPTHMHYSRTGHRPDYPQRYCALCPGDVTGDETHIITTCPTLRSVFNEHAPPFRGLFRLCDLSSFDHLCPADRLRAMLGNPPRELLVKNMTIWKAEATPLCGRFVYDLYSHISKNAPSLTTCLSSDSEIFSDDDDEEDDMFETITIPPKFTIDPTPTDNTPFQPLNPAGQTIVGKHVFFKWPNSGWYLGQIAEWNADPMTKVGTKVANFKVTYPGFALSVGYHALSLDNYCSDGNGLAPEWSWVFLSPTP